MQTKLLVYLSVALYSLCGLALVFMPQELLALQETSSPSIVALLAQLFGAALLGLAKMNWTARGSLLGGIYGRAVVAGNFTFTFIGAMVTLRAQLDGSHGLGLWVGAVLILALAVGFGYLMFGRNAVKLNNTQP